MADNDVWTNVGVIAAPAATDRMPIATGPNAGGYSLRGSFLWGGGTGSFQWNGALGLGVAPAVRLHVKSAGDAVRIETTTARGGGNNYLTWYDPTGRAGCSGFGGASNHFLLMNDLAGHIIFGTSGVNRWLITSTGSFEPDADNAYDIGRSGARVKVVFAATGTINTSDEREKTWRGGLTKAELRAATRIIGELGFYQWNDAVAEKGKDARYHFGARAQRVWQIMADEKLVAPITGTGKNQRPGKTPYAFLCFDEWEEQTEAEMTDKVIPAVFEGKGKSRVEVEPERTERTPTGKTLVTIEAGNRFGLRTDQFVMFLVAAQEQRLAAVEAFIAKAG